MIALGLALILIAALSTIFAVVASSTTSTAMEMTAFGVTVSPTPLALFLAGALSVALLGLGFTLVSRGTRRTARTHRELKQLRKENANAATSPAAERDEASKAGTSADTSAGTAPHSTPSGTNTRTSSNTRTGSGSDANSTKDSETNSDQVPDGRTEPPVERHPNA
ncbi:MAG: hypothetical protein H7270_10970 [Dermatophilaceae bacterium]|nr:hypothetical protein [Dermatophilaceae bacterium]